MDLRNIADQFIRRVAAMQSPELSGPAEAYLQSELIIAPWTTSAEYFALQDVLAYRADPDYRVVTLPKRDASHSLALTLARQRHERSHGVNGLPHEADVKEAYRLGSDGEDKNQSLISAMKLYGYSAEQALEMDAFMGVMRLRDDDELPIYMRGIDIGEQTLYSGSFHNQGRIENYLAGLDIRNEDELYKKYEVLHLEGRELREAVVMETIHLGALYRAKETKKKYARETGPIVEFRAEKFLRTLFDKVPDEVAMLMLNNGVTLVFDAEAQDNGELLSGKWDRGKNRLTVRGFDYNTAVHEMAHMVSDALRWVDSALWKEMYALVDEAATRCARLEVIVEQWPENENFTDALIETHLTDNQDKELLRSWVEAFGRDYDTVRLDVRYLQISLSAKPYEHNPTKSKGGTSSEIMANTYAAYKIKHNGHSPPDKDKAQIEFFAADLLDFIDGPVMDAVSKPGRTAGMVK